MTFETGGTYCCYLHMVAAIELCCLSDNSGYAPFDEGRAYCFAHVGWLANMSVSLKLVQPVSGER